MGFLVVLEQPCRLVEPAEIREELDALIPRNGSVSVVVHDEHRCLHLVNMEHRRVLDVKVKRPRLPHALSDTALAMLILAGAGDARAPTDATVGRCHIPDRCSGTGGGEHIRTCYEPGCLVAAPALALDRHPALVGDGIFLAKGLGSGADAVVGALARVSYLIYYVRNEDYVPP